MSKRGLPAGITMRHDAHYVEEMARSNRSIGKIIPIENIMPNPDQPRVEFGDLTDLTNSVKEKGVLEPLLVKHIREKGIWLIIAGERRWRAAAIAGLRELPCIELDIDEKGVAEIALIENLQRKDLTVWEEADGLAALAERYKYTHEEIAKKIGKSRSTVTEAMSIASLPTKIRQRAISSQINSKSTLLEISRQFSEKEMDELLDVITEKNLKREDVRQAVRPEKSAVRNELKRSDIKLKTESVNNSENGESQGNYNKKVFRFINKAKTFSLDLRFNRQNFYDKDDIVAALQETLRSLE